MTSLLVRVLIICLRLFIKVFEMLGMTKKLEARIDRKLRDHIMKDRNDKAKTIIDFIITIKAQDSAQYCEDLMRYAVLRNNDVIVRHLIEKGTDADSTRKKGLTALMRAVIWDRVKCVKVLLEAKANIHIVNDEGLSALQMMYFSPLASPQTIEAVHNTMKSQTHDVEKLIDELIIAGCTLYHAVFFKDLKLLELIMTRGGLKINSRGPWKMTALHATVQLNNLALAKWLVDNGADVNAVDEQGRGPLDFAAEDGKKDMVRFLLREGANPNLEATFDGSTPLFTTVECSTDREKDYTECVEILIEYGAIPRNASRDTCTIFDYALDNERFQMIDVLICHLAILKKFDDATAESVMHCNKEEHREAFQDVEKNYELCQLILDAIVFRKLKLFDLLIESDEKMKIYVRNETFLKTVEEFCAKHKLKKFCSYYYRQLKKSVAKAHHIVMLEDKAIPVICKMFESEDGQNQCYYVARRIVEYLDEPDLINLNQMCKHV